MGQAGVIIIAILLAFALTYLRFTSKNRNGFEIFLLKKGKHYSIRVRRFLHSWFKISPLIFKDTIRFTVVFSDGCDYSDDYMGNDADDVNKLYGLSYGFRDHINSVRIGWRYNDNLKVIQLFAYSYVNGVRDIFHLDNVNLYEEIRFVISQYSKNKVCIRVINSDENVTQYKLNIPNHWLKFRLYPYFGGNLVAPQDMKIFIKNKKSK